MRRFALLLVVSCASPPEPAHPAAVTPPSESASANASAVVVHAATWNEVTQSLAPGEALPCGAADDALTRVATAAAAARARAAGAPDPDAVALALRAAGEPDLNPRILSATGRAPLDVASRLASLRSGPLTRCGIGRAETPHGGEVLVAIAVDAQADLSPLPMRARTGEWMTFEARLHVRAKSAKLVVLGPRGAPRSVPTALDGDAVRARFALDRPGAFAIQLVADLDEGPRPLLEARMFADVDPPDALDVEPAPGEDRADLGAMVAATRVAEARAELRRDPALDALAQAHAARMRDAGTVAHDLGDGDLTRRFGLADLRAKVIGENVAHADSLARAHRALYASPSHRMNLLRADYTHLGIGVAEGEGGSVWVCEVFAAR